MREIIKKEVLKRNLEWNDENAHKVGVKLTSRNPFYFGEILLKYIYSLPHEYVLIEGIKSINEVIYLKRKLKENFKIVAILAPKNVRFKRIKERAIQEGRNEIKTLKDLERRERREREYGLDKILRKADYKILNCGIPKEKISFIFRKILHELWEG